MGFKHFARCCRPLGLITTKTAETHFRNPMVLPSRGTKSIVSMCVYRIMKIQTYGALTRC
jgi:hypothetical protein